MDDEAGPGAFRELFLPALGRGALLGAAAWAAIGALPALMLLPAAIGAGALERWGARGGWRRPAAALLVGPLAAGLALAAAYHSLYARESFLAGPLQAGQSVARALERFPADPDPTRLLVAREWLAGLPWWHARDEGSACVVATATLLGAILALLVGGRLLLVSRNPELSARLPGLVTLGTAVGACALGLLWSAWLLPTPAPGDPGLSGLSLWGFAVLVGMAGPLAFGATDALAALRWGYR